MYLFLPDQEQFERRAIVLDSLKESQPPEGKSCSEVLKEELFLSSPNYALFLTKREGFYGFGLLRYFEHD
jgi:hypothetical protein